MELGFFENKIIEVTNRNKKYFEEISNSLI